MSAPANSDATPIQSSPILQGERVAFTGILASMTHRQAMDLVEQHGGTAGQHVSNQTTLLVVGEEGWPLESDGRVSVKLEQVRQLHEKGEPVRILAESEWLKLLGIEPVEQKQQKLLTPAMISQLLNLSVHEIRRWEREGLIRPVKKVFRLPYFDFQEVTGARRLSELAKAGVSLEELSLGLKRLRHLIPNVDRPLAQLEVLTRGAHLLYRDKSGLIEPTSGQRVFDFEPETKPPADEEITTLPIFPGLQGESIDIDRSKWTAEEWFQEGIRLADEGDAESAIEAFRLTLIEEPFNALHHFHLADALYRIGKLDAAIERYHMAIEIDHNFLESWSQLGCLLAETNETNGAIEAFQVALDLHPDYPDAHFHLAELLERKGQRDEAASHWKRYLEFDQRGPWAEIARQRLQDQTLDAPCPIGDA